MFCQTLLSTWLEWTVHEKMCIIICLPLFSTEFWRRNSIGSQRWESLVNSSWVLHWKVPSCALWIWSSLSELSLFWMLVTSREILGLTSPLALLLISWHFHLYFRRARSTRDAVPLSWWHLPTEVHHFAHLWALQPTELFTHYFLWGRCFAAQWICRAHLPPLSTSHPDQCQRHKGGQEHLLHDEYLISWCTIWWYAWQCHTPCDGSANPFHSYDSNSMHWCPLLELLLYSHLSVLQKFQSQWKKSTACLTTSKLWPVIGGTIHLSIMPVICCITLYRE